MTEKFFISAEKIKHPSSQDDISKTIEELLGLSKLIPKRWDDEKSISEITNSQLDGKKNYDSSKYRGEKTDLYEKQLEDSRKDNKNTVIENELCEEKGVNNGHRSEMWDKDKEEVNGHKNVPLIWHEVSRLEKERKEKPIEKKLK